MDVALLIDEETDAKQGRNLSYLGAA